MFKLANGCNVCCFNKMEANVLYKEIFTDNVYLRSGITVKNGDTVLDIGSNIGFFSIYLAEKYQDITIHSFEPIPEIFELLEKNLDKYQDRVHLHNIGLSNENRRVKFQFCPNTTVLSTRHQAKLDSQREVFKSQLLGHSTDQGEGLLVRAIALLPKFLREKATNIALNSLLRTKEVVAEVKPLSLVLDELNIESVDLLKIDTEGSELEILSGIKQQHWQRLRQIVVEVHQEPDIFTIKTLLQSNGYKINDIMRLPSDEFIIYATRNKEA